MEKQQSPLCPSLGRNTQLFSDIICNLLVGSNSLDNGNTAKVCSTEKLLLVSFEASDKTERVKIKFE